MLHGRHGVLRPRNRPADDDVLELMAAADGQVGPLLDGDRIRDSLRHSEALRTAIVNSTLDGLITMDHRGCILEFNPAAERMFGYSREEAVGREVAELIIPPGIRRRHREAFARFLRTGESRILNKRTEMTAMRSDGTEFPVELTITRIEAPGPPSFAAFIRDVGERQRVEDEIAFLAYHDKLTELPNRAMFEKIVELAIARARRHHLEVAVLYLDIDNFKLVNDSLGHAAGDELLRQIAARLVRASRTTDTVARLGGDEFLVLLADLSGPGADPRSARNAVLTAEAVASRILGCFDQPFILGETEYYATASVGISVFPLDAEDARTLLRNSDAAMYRSKKTGPGGYMIAPMSLGDSDNKLSFVAKLRQAVADRSWELHYQPIVDLVRGDVVGVEALIRWRDKDRGLIAPSQFIPLAEEMGFIGTIGDWVIDELLAQSQRWRARGMDYIVSFNLSPRQLWLPDLSERLLSRIDAAGVDPSSLLIEITESTAMADPDRTQAILLGLRRHGLRFAIDDFGTGYSSLSRLKDLAVDVLKIDRSFVCDVPHDRNAGTMVKGIVQLAHSLGMAPLAEGIETEDQWRFLVDNDCLLGQGYYFKHPAPADAIGDLWRQGAFAMSDGKG
jgi:diguanylate cyclase (GGDEF)-like protein/PAS domain S-box-containing protein